MKIQLLGKRIAGVGAILIIPLLIGAAAWLTHVIDCLKDGEWGFLIAGALMFPIAIIHGIGVWFGFW